MSLKTKAPLRCIATLTLLALSSSCAVAKQTKIESHEDHARSIYEELVEIRRDLFDHPEASGEEKRTSEIVADYLTELGLEVKTNLGGYGVVGILKGSQPGKGIAWRADMDAAKFEFEEHGDHEAVGGSEKNKVAHVCGHDVHTTIGLGIANTLSQNVENLAGTAYFLFQPAEESQEGAKAMINDGLFEIIQADEIYAAHAAPIPTGVITTSPGNLFAHSRYINIEFAGLDEAQALSGVVNSIMMSVTRITSPNHFINLLNISDAELGMGSPGSIYKDYVLFGGQPTIRKSDQKLVLSTELFTTEHKDIQHVADTLKRQILLSKFGNRFNSIEVLHEREGVNNDAELVSQASKLIKHRFGEGAMQDNFGHIPFASEDFGHFQKHVPGVYFFIGVADQVKGNVAFPHMPNFEVDEQVIHHAVSRFSTSIEHRLRQ